MNNHVSKVTQIYKDMPVTFQAASGSCVKFSG